MRRTTALRTVFGLVAIILVGGLPTVRSQGRPPAPVGTRVPPPQANRIVAVRAGRLFDSKTGRNLTNQIILIKGDRITDVGPSVQIPAEATVIDLSRATVLPGLIDAHLHLFTETQRNHVPVSNNGQGTPEFTSHDRILLGYVEALKDLNAGFTTIVDLGVFAGPNPYDIVDLRDSINNGLMMGPRMQVAGPNFEDMPGWSDSPESARAAVRELAKHHVDWVKIHPTGRYKLSPGSLTDEVTKGFTLELTKAIVDEAHKQGLKVASHTFGGDSLEYTIQAGVDAPQHMLYPTDAQLAEMKQKNMPSGPTLFDYAMLDSAQMKEFGNSQWRMQEKAWKRVHAAGIKQGLSSGALANSSGFPHGVQIETFKYYVQWGMTPAEALQSAMTVNAKIIGWEDRVGSIEKGKFADLVAVSGDPLANIAEIQNIKFVMKGGEVVRSEFPVPPTPKVSLLR